MGSHDQDDCIASGEQTCGLFPWLPASNGFPYCESLACAARERLRHE